MFKDIFEPETYIIKRMSRRRRSLMSQFRTGILLLEIETGRYLPIFYKTLKKNRKRTANERPCKLCRLNDIENEYHFVVVYPLPWPLLVGGVRCSRLWSTSQLLRPSGQQCSHSGGVCPQIQGRQCCAYVGAVEEMMCVVCVDVTEGA